MAISDVPAAAGTTATTTSDSDLRQPSLRRRSSAGVLFDAARDSGSDNSLTGKITDDDNIKDHKPNNHAASDDNVGAAANDAGQEHRQPVADFKYAYRPSVPAHRRIKESPLSSDNIFRQSHAGLFNLCIVVLVAVNSRLIIENLMKYGWLIKYGFWFSSKSLRDWPLFMCCLSLAIFPLAAFVVERLAQQKCISEPVVVLLHLIISTVELCYPVLVILRCDSAFVSGVTLMLLTCIVWLKLVSYAHTNYDMRALTVSNEKGETLPNTLIMEYPYTVTFRSLAYFMVAPTLCYQTSYPRTPSVRKGWVFRQLVKLIIFTGVMGFIIEQYMNPIVQNSTHPLKGNLLYAIERILKLSVPNIPFCFSSPLPLPHFPLLLCFYVKDHNVAAAIVVLQTWCDGSRSDIDLMKEVVYTWWKGKIERQKRKLNKKRRCRKSLSLAANDDTYVALNNSHVEAALGKSMAVPSGSNRLRDLWD
ncbi:Diacylglycerol O-acyltransferase 1C [Glycine soja]|uniref:diacylglycerol O-acyltransferase n=1 Tax=Glycine soja TaxID=3848 RepID=A0A445IXM5_GLYSO|nr:Diacylglycerol O-acyltransferase 1C [Glycine soja]